MMYWLGAVSQERLDTWKAAAERPPSLHSPLFYPDVEVTLVTGIGTMVATVIELLKPDNATETQLDTHQNAGEKR
jgi:hypothetical protein